MVRNKTELVSAAQEWTNIAKRDIQKKLMQFMRITNLPVERVASLLDVDINTVNRMIEGTLDIPMSLFAKILISTGHAIQIVPEVELAKAQCKCHQNAIQHRGPARGADGRFVSRGQMPIPNGYPMPPRGEFPPFGAMPEGYPMPPQGNFDGFNMPAPEEVFGNGNVPPMVNPTQQVNAPVQEAPTTQAPNNDAAVEALFEAVRNNPQLAGMFGAVLDKLNQQ